MATVQPRREQTAFRHTGTYGARARVAYAPQPARETAPTPVKAVKPRQQVQMAWIMLILAASIAGGTLGMAYLSACASVTREGYRKAKLKTILRQEREKAQYWRELRGQVMTPALIEHRAKVQGMIRADENSAITLR